MPKQLTARPPLDAPEEQHVRQLAHSVHAPADGIVQAKIVAHSWEGLRTNQIAEAVRGHPQTVRERLHAFNERGCEGLGVTGDATGWRAQTAAERAGAPHDALPRPALPTGQTDR